MKAAVIDMGSNSMRLAIAESDPYAMATPVYRATNITGLSQGADADGRLSREAIDRTLAVLEDYAAIIKEHDVAMVRIAATAAMRRAPNAEAVLDQVEAVLGVRPKIISGEMEASLTFIGVLSDPFISQLGVEFQVFDIGGGSTEVILGFNRPRIIKSLPLGCVRLRDQFLLTDPPTESELAGARNHVMSLLQAELEPGKGDQTLGLAVAGTATTLVAIELGLEPYDPNQTHRFQLTKAMVNERLAQLASLPLVERQKVVGLQPERADTIISGAIILSSLMDYFEHDSVTVSERDLLDGLALTAVADYNKRAAENSEQDENK